MSPACLIRVSPRAFAGILGKRPFFLLSLLDQWDGTLLRWGIFAPHEKHVTKNGADPGGRGLKDGRATSR